MRATVPQGEGVVSGGSGEEMFTGMLDEHLAGAAPGRPGAAAEQGGPGAAWTRALADAVFRRMRPGAAPAAAPAAGPVTPAAARASLDGPAPLAFPVPPAGRR
jgi:flagellar protein FlgJ